MFVSKINRTFEIRRNVRTAQEPKELYHRIIPIVPSVLFLSSLPIKVVAALQNKYTNNSQTVVSNSRPFVKRNEDF